MTKTKVKTRTSKTKTHYQWVERNISKIGEGTYRIRVGSNDAYAPSKEKARLIKKTFLNK